MISIFIYLASVLIVALLAWRASLPRKKDRVIGYIKPKNENDALLDSAWVMKAERDLLRKQLRGEVKWKQ